MKIIKVLSIGFISISILSFLYVSVLAFINPQSVMDLVRVDLGNNDAISSIRGVYGGVGLTIVISLSYLAYANRKQALTFLTILWGSYAISRLLTIAVEGKLGDFGTQWLIIESLFCLMAVTLLFFQRKQFA